MKRNETILVYSVTGLLVVILGVAIAFGDGGVHAGTSADLKTLDQLEPVGPETGEPRAGGTGAGGAATDPGVVPNDAGSGGKVDGQAGEGARPDAPTTVVPLNVVATPPAVDDVATRALVLLGESARDGAYRVVSVRHGDTFSQLVQRWCGSLDQMDIAASLNEEFDLGRLDAGTRLYLPWVDDAALLTALERRKTGASGPGAAAARSATLPTGLTNEASASPGPAPGAARGQEYKVKAGDMLWNIAVARVGAGKANKFIEAVRDLNPDLRADPNRLVAGKTILLPR